MVKPGKVEPTHGSKMPVIKHGEIPKAKEVYPRAINQTEKVTFIQLQNAVQKRHLLPANVAGSVQRFKYT